ncbi:iron chaperone [Schleiferilactobacillus perolens]|jgi:uncharacterized protein YdhG (YjbR/CyaY superfamily)|uniref:YdhG-like domain-containing protein n=1 Tax=Schleiferilactobacillus perolens DSM 12744 TaxID=1423792 RepID=A0A0R1MXJ0_9LACO|nr:DUF1801 domain-containing protein [Schleiferilactobacillus perolens]KRL12753.1 hypothetical protein FD09_GL002739 [Schleiferilactobacillus perolens DSM 12744]MCI1892037.1 DUF1801 domain-containing protein [Schleiferilactobacillus harbinensis]MCI1912810.1 DUF1801 domain-containing protein [Schleiferilactobacillus harbinensis]MCI2171345.1 DUF1801 domain-containing protein [Schleiferilactobacillus perolens]
MLESTIIEEYILAQTKDIQPRLTSVYHTIKAVMPDAAEKISYQMPTFWQHRNLIHFAAFKNHIGLYPGGTATTVFADQLTGYKTGKGSIQLPNDAPLPLALITDIARWCLAHNTQA